MEIEVQILSFYFGYYFFFSPTISKKNLPQDSIWMAKTVLNCHKSISSKEPSGSGMPTFYTGYHPFVFNKK